MNSLEKFLKKNLKNGISSFNLECVGYIDNKMYIYISSKQESHYIDFTVEDNTLTFQRISG